MMKEIKMDFDAQSRNEEPYGHSFIDSVRSGNSKHSRSHSDNPNLLFFPDAGHQYEGKNRKYSIVIVDDQFTNRKVLEKLMLSIDFNLTVTTFGDPYKALEFSRLNTPDLVITDYKMPQMDGVELIRRFRKLPFCTAVPMMVVTIVGDRAVRNEALKAGAMDFLTRPFDHQECLIRCRNLLTLRKQQLIINNRAQWLEEQVAKATQQIRVREKETLLRLGKAGEFRDEDTGNHVLRMAKYSRLIAEKLGMTEQECDSVELAAPMHDIGKIGVSDLILLKPGKLTNEEFNQIKLHTTIGYEILKDSPSPYLQLGAVIALNHHEKFDGSGYPAGLRGEDIPRIARVVAVADVYDALTSRRPYKKKWTHEQAVTFIIEQSGKHFDPECVLVLLAAQDAIIDIGLQYYDG
jgi:two-component system response regulator RpfG